VSSKFSPFHPRFNRKASVLDWRPGIGLQSPQATALDALDSERHPNLTPPPSSGIQPSLGFTGPETDSAIASPVAS
jgi:hypothetical protein